MPTDDLDFRALGGPDLAQLAMERLRPEGVQLFLKKIAHCSERSRAHIEIKPHESSAEASRQTPALLSPRTTTITSRPGMAPLAIRQ